MSIADVAFARGGVEPGWRAETAGLATLTFYKRAAPEDPETGDVEPLPSSLLAAIGTQYVDYSAFVVARVSEERAEELADFAWTLGVRARVGADRAVEGYAGPMDLDALPTRAGTWEGRGVEVARVPGLYWVQFAYPVKNVWRHQLRDCVSELVLEVPSRAFLVEATAEQDITACSDLVQALEAVEPFRTIDRAAPAVLDHDGPVRVVLRPRVEIADLDLPPDAPVVVRTTPTGPSLETTSSQLVRTLLTHPAVLAMSEVSTELAGPSDERQALLAARSWNPSTGAVQLPPGGYAGWLPTELTGSTGQATIAFFDTGIDNHGILGPPPAPQSFVSHPDLVGRLVGRYNIVTDPPAASPVLWDENGHGSLTVSVAVGAGSSGGLGADGFLKGQGIAPEAKYWMVNTLDYAAPSSCTDTGTTPSSVTSRVVAGHDWVAKTGPSPATIANHSWNSGTLYNNWVVEGFDLAAIDASSTTSGFQSLLPVVSAGNDDPPNPGLVQFPALAKNVVAVGSVDGWVGGPGWCANPEIPDDFDGPFGVSVFSRVGTSFGPGSGTSFPRIKPDIVAPGWRVDGARPDPIECGANASLCGATLDQISDAYSYARGTSFAAPVVAGAAALKTKWFRNRGTEPKASLLKAALIATADSLGPVMSGEVLCYDPPNPGDCRPSHKSGWGLVNLDRLTAATPARFIRNEHINFDEVGDFWRSQFLVPDDPALPIFIVLVWNDIPNQTGHWSTNQTLKRDLSLWVEDYYKSTLGRTFWAGNNFQENVTALDTGWSHHFIGSWSGAVADTVNTVEAVLIPPAFGYGDNKGFKIVVIDEAHPNSFPNPSDFPQQSFSIYAWNARFP